VFLKVLKLASGDYSTAGIYQIIYQNIGFKTKRTQINLDQNRKLDVSLAMQSELLEEVVVTRCGSVAKASLAWEKFIRKTFTPFSIIALMTSLEDEAAIETAHAFAILDERKFEPNDILLFKGC